MKSLKEFKGFVERYKPLMGLQDWQIIVSYDKEDDSCYAETKFESFEYKQATIKITKKYKELSKREREEVAIHELSHIILQKIEENSFTFINILI